MTASAFNSAADNSLDTDLHRAVYQHDMNMLQRLLRNPHNINKQGNMQRTALHAAIAEKEFEMIEALVSHGADWDIRDFSDHTPFEAAINQEYTVDELKQLVRLRATVDIKGAKQTALHVAAYGGRTDIIGYLVKLGLDIEARDSYGQTPLLVAIGEARPDMALAFLEQEADATAADEDGNTSLHSAIEEGQTALIEKLLAHPRGLMALEASNDKNMTPLGLAAENGDITVVKMLVEAGALINTNQPEESQPLSLAAMQGHSQVVHYLLSHGADIEKYQELCNNDHKKLLGHTICAKNNHLKYGDVLRLLANAGLDLDRADEDGNTALHRACMNSDYDRISALIDRGANVWVLNNKFQNPLDLSMPEKDYGGPDQFDIPAIIMKLLDAGADPNMSLADGVEYSPLHNAIMYGNPMIVAKLLEKGADPDKRATVRPFMTPFLAACKKGDARNVELLLEAKADIEQRNAFGESPLHLAAASGNLEIVRTLLNLGNIDINETTSEGRTALHYACKDDRPEIVAALVAAGGDLLKKDNKGVSALHLGLAAGSENLLDWHLSNPDAAGMIDWNEKTAHHGRNLLHAAVHAGRQGVLYNMLKLGANVAQADDYGLTPLHHAVLLKERSALSAIMISELRQSDSEHIKNYKAGHGWHYIHFAAAMGHIQTCAAMLSAAPDVNCQTDDGDTALHLAARHGNSRMVEYLARMKKADMTMTNNNGETPLDAAKRLGHKSVVDAFEKLMAEAKDVKQPQPPKPAL